ncbi:hypothetical protein [Mastigocoleus sp. MO_188.B34]|uniref:hypothetical protein n=1 Tax=Mastigocoleus sp. MO_188.B34 TaxID=3036635 RepID=UPI002605C0E8|nr:hypothetical protein [Mastigocoleus sp. MO_188.B34]MDJ0695807.1 hypothetical protein [Mastigocoleus sp. MO_188.B34]
MSRLYVVSIAVCNGWEVATDRVSNGFGEKWMGNVVVIFDSQRRRKDCDRSPQH